MPPTDGVNGYTRADFTQLQTGPITLADIPPDAPYEDEEGGHAFFTWDAGRRVWVPFRIWQCYTVTDNAEAEPSQSSSKPATASLPQRRARPSANPSLFDEPEP